AFQRGAGEGAGLELAYDDVGRPGDYLVHDVGGRARGFAARRAVFGHARVLPRPTAAVPAVFTEIAGGVDHRHALAAARVDQRTDHGQRFPGIRSARVAPAFDRV